MITRRLVPGFATVCLACTTEHAGVPPDSASASGAFVSGAQIGTPTAGAAGEWTMPARDYANSRYSSLAQVTTANVANLKAAWTFSTGVLRGHEGQPLVVGNTMYLVTPYPNVAY